MDIMSIIMLVVGAIVGFAVFFVIKFLGDKKTKSKAEIEANNILNNAKNKAIKIENEAKNKMKDFENRSRKNVEIDIKKQKDKLAQMEKEYEHKDRRLEDAYRRKEEELERQLASIKERTEKVDVKENRLEEVKKDVSQKLEDLRKKLENVSSLTSDQAKEELKRVLEDEAKAEAAKNITVIEEDAKARADEKAKRIIGMAISRFAGEYAAEKTANMVPLPSEELKGKIIGKEGRNIRAIEALCGVDLIIDETPEAVIISGFDPVRREVARLSLEQLMQDGRIHPGRIEEVVSRTKKDLFKSIKADGEKACLELGLHNVNSEIQKILGSLKYRTSYAQNNYSHSIEVGMLSGLMAAELGVDVKMARRAGLFHDLGKAMDHSVEGSHAVIGAEFAKRYGEAETVCHAIRAHHEDEKPRTVMAYIVQAADALSSARPGARKSMAENYIQRLEDLESIANSFEGVERTFAIQAGREIRVMVDSSRVTDEQALMLSRDIARKVEKEMNFPGQIKISVVRETRAIEHAR